MPLLFNFLIILLAAIYYIYTSQSVFAVSLLCIYILGIVFCWIFGKKKKDVIYIFSLFFLIYGVLLILTQWIFIDGNQEMSYGHYMDYFNHSDASGSFYHTAVLDAGPKSWDNLLANTLLFSFYSDYPLFSLMINALHLFGIDIGVSDENMRMFLRMPNLFFAAGLLVIMARYFNEIGKSSKQTIHDCTIFGIFTYLFLTSVVFTRDLHVAFFYTLTGYYCLSPAKHRLIYLKFFLIALICFGLRPENGMFAMIFPVYYYFKNTPLNAKMIIGGLCALVIFIYIGALDTFVTAHEGFNEHTKSVAGGGLYSLFNSLPFPLSSVFNIVYSFIMPFPLTMYIVDPHIGIFGLPSVVMPFINVIMVGCLVFFISRHRKDYRVLWFFILTVLFIAMTTTIEPNVRRTFAMIPALYMIFIEIKPFIPRRRYKQIVNNSILFLITLNIPAIIYLLFKGKLL